VTDSIENDKALEYLVSGLHLLAYLHRSFPEILPNAVLHPISAACRLKEIEEERREESPGNDSGTETMISTSTATTFTGAETETSTSPLNPPETEDIITSIGGVVHEHLAQLSDRFGTKNVHDVLSQKEDQRIIRFLGFVEGVAQKLGIQQEKGK
jgi:hypothetical protein